jgi:hypothetical protein
MNRSKISWLESDGESSVRLRGGELLDGGVLRSIVDPPILSG